jgi:FixJ family two-component response regulator
MDAQQYNRNLGGNAADPQTGPGESDVNQAAQQLQATVSSFAQQAQASQETLIALINQMAQQLQAANSKEEQNARQIERLSTWIENNRR